MKLHRQWNEWTCGVCAYAMCMDVEPETIVEMIGHDGSAIITPDGADITKQVAGFVATELNLVAWKLGFAPVEVLTKPAYADDKTLVPGFSTTEDMLNRFPLGQRMALLVKSRNYEGSWHYVAYENGDAICYDPARGIVSLCDVPACGLVTIFAKRAGWDSTTSTPTGLESSILAASAAGDLCS